MSKQVPYNGILVFICTDAWAPICILVHVCSQNETVQLKPIGSLVDTHDSETQKISLTSKVYYFMDLYIWSLLAYGRFRNL